MGGEPVQYECSPEVVSRRIRGEILLVPIRRTSADLEGFFTLNPTAAEIWQGIQAGHSIHEMAATLATRYTVSETEAEADVLRLIDELETLGAIRRKGAGN